mmetsp:Transcript_79738/g.159223  ORF Transcript_79738/g.159223 Transcript_79738/m.159223 type:complete len:91 (+) Transcript_79738:313-585(+)
MAAAALKDARFVCLPSSSLPPAWSAPTLKLSACTDKGPLAGRAPLTDEAAGAGPGLVEAEVGAVGGTLPEETTDLDSLVIVLCSSPTLSL